jgi:hypothetical protein
MLNWSGTLKSVHLALGFTDLDADRLAASALVYPVGHMSAL